MRQIAIYGKGGIGKSTVTANVSACLALSGMQVLQVGCDPKQDSTRTLLGGAFAPAVLQSMLLHGDDLTYDQVVRPGFAGVQCVEAGGPEPGVGCAGRGIIATFEVLEKLGVYAADLDYVLYDVLGDVVCGGFAMPIRQGYADEVYIVTSGEMMSLYAANNICQGIARYTKQAGTRLAGIIGNGRGVRNEEELLREFSARVGAELVAYIPREPMVAEAEFRGQTVVEYSPESSQADGYRDLASSIISQQGSCVPQPMSQVELEDLVRGLTVIA